ncbi:hypothetical protein SAY87_024280 [Trapa incisa]|uniref:Uncharacterized protein n=1 Tax=Trapa incisa TaxID=236973 RepID=A0AAN7JFC2_9MYRT|nr:hypothetical protein SAY87_024280 [Trapa incisa]
MAWPWMALPLPASPASAHSFNRKGKVRQSGAMPSKSICLYNPRDRKRQSSPSPVSCFDAKALIKTL